LGGLDFAIYDQINELRGIVSCPLEVRGFTKNKLGPFLLLDQARNQIAISDAFSYSGNRFFSLRQSGLTIRTYDGNKLAMIHAARTSQGYQIDIYLYNISQLLVLSPVASIMFLP
jgi:hypothetical protein